ncbi:hypothetical protein PR003_g22085 [Phytophthora rubi]|uniref:Uncharacterized protein n=1 Tax=Phytophthora rubi TaxID=129364 RepID=A0A6A4D8L8_9STRA|nr:hypothetical protein PR002_g21589 [Phytophthora rubi]KAE9303140.1 hypothetical protein PR003_g22085 [Phytophthora rubi]
MNTGTWKRFSFSLRLVAATASVAAVAALNTAKATISSNTMAFIFSFARLLDGLNQKSVAHSTPAILTSKNSFDT